MQGQGHRVLGIAVEGDLAAGVATMGGKLQAGMGRKTAEGRGA